MNSSHAFFYWLSFHCKTPNSTAVFPVGLEQFQFRYFSRTTYAHGFHINFDPVSSEHKDKWLQIAPCDVRPKGRSFYGCLPTNRKYISYLSSLSQPAHEKYYRNYCTYRVNRITFTSAIRVISCNTYTITVNMNTSEYEYQFVLLH